MMRALLSARRFCRTSTAHICIWLSTTRCLLHPRKAVGGSEIDRRDRSKTIGGEGGLRSGYGAINRAWQASIEPRAGQAYLAANRCQSQMAIAQRLQGASDLRQRPWGTIHKADLRDDTRRNLRSANRPR